MKLYDHLTNTSTIILISFATVTILNGTPEISGDGVNMHVPSFKAPPDQLKSILWAFAAVIALGNISGRPKPYVDDLWERSGFGDKFFPFWFNDHTQRRICAGFMELAAVAMQISDPDKKELLTGKLGYAMLMVLYARGSMIQLQVFFSKNPFGFVLSGAGALISAWLLLANTDQDTMYSEPAMPLMLQENTARIV